jgi:hypothetical protein
MPVRDKNQGAGDAAPPNSTEELKVSTTTNTTTNLIIEQLNKLRADWATACEEIRKEVIREDPDQYQNCLKELAGVKARLEEIVMTRLQLNISPRPQADVLNAVAGWVQ